MFMHAETLQPHTVRFINRSRRRIIRQSRLMQMAVGILVIEPL